MVWIDGKRGLLHQRVKVGGKHTVHLPSRNQAAEHPVPEAWCAPGDGVVDVLPAMPGLGVDRFECGCILGGVPTWRQERRSPEEVVDPVNPDLVAGVDFPFGEVVLAAENLSLEVPDHGVASGNS
jgi:hypothetical protein